MILKYFGWKCTLCDHGKLYDPMKEEVPEKCPACGEGTGYTYGRREMEKETKISTN